MDWQECLGRRLVKEVRQDRDLIQSLLQSSERKLQSEERLEMSDITADSKLSLAYDSLRELLESLALKNGYKIYNHECYTAFLKEVLGESGKGDDFDSLRKIRNSANYYGKHFTPEEAKRIIDRITSLRSELETLMKG